jgi:molybdopterin converting factor small subunit
MKIKISVSGIADYSVLDDDENLELHETATIWTVYSRLKIPIHLRPFYKCYLNYKPARMRDKLKEGDEIFFMTLAAGG